MGKIIDFLEAKKRLRPNERSTSTADDSGIRKHHQLKLEWADQRTQVKALCSCGEEFKRWAPEEGHPPDTMDVVRKLYRAHLRGLHEGAAVSG